MSENQKGNQSNEIDLIELFQLMGNGIKNTFIKIFQIILFLVVFGIKNIHYLALFSIIGGAIGFGVSKVSKPYYSSELIAQPNGIGSQDMITYISDLHMQCKTNNHKGLIKALNIDSAYVVDIKDIQAFHFIDLNKDGVGDFVDYQNSHNPKDTNARVIKSRFLLKVELYDNSIFSIIKDGVFHYINNTPYIVKLNELRKNELNEQIATIEYEIAKLDSLQNVDYFNENIKRPYIKHESQLTFLAEKDKRMYYHDKLSLVNIKQSYQKELALSTQPITIIKDFSELEKAENAKSSYLLKYTILFLVIGFILLLSLNVKNQLKNWIQESQEKVLKS